VVGTEHFFYSSYIAITLKSKQKRKKDCSTYSTN